MMRSVAMDKIKDILYAKVARSKRGLVVDLHNQIPECLKWAEFT